MPISLVKLFLVNIFLFEKQWKLTLFWINLALWANFNVLNVSAAQLMKFKIEISALNLAFYIC